jgi:hypothetical protein
VESIAKTEMRSTWTATLYVMTNLMAVYFAVGAFSFLVSALSDRRNRAIGVIFAVLLFSFLINFVAQFWDPFSGKSTAQSPMSNMLSISSKEPTTSSSVGTNDPQSSPTNSATEAKRWSIASLSVMNYYRPATIIQSGKFPVVDVSILVGIGGCFWIAAGIYFSRRSICTT